MQTDEPFPHRVSFRDPYSTLLIIPVQKLFEEIAYLVEWNHAEVIVQVGMVCTGDYQKFLVVTSQPFIGILAEIA